MVLTLLAASLKEDRDLNPIEKVAKDIGTVVLKVVSTPFNFVHDKLDEMAEKNNLYKKYKEHYNGLILLNSTPFADAPEKRQDREREIELINNGKLLALAALSIPKMYATENLRKFDDKIEETVEICETHDPAGIAACLRGMMQREESCRTLYNTEKALLIFGNDDKFIPTGKADEIASNCNKAKIKRLMPCGHNSFIECKKECVDAIKEFATE